MFYGVRVHLLAFQSLLFLHCPLFLTLLSFTYGVTSRAPFEKVLHFIWLFVLGHSDFLCALKRTSLKRHIVFLFSYVSCF